MYIKNRNFEVDGRKGIVFMGWITQCRECSIKSQCLRYPDRAVARQVCFLYEKKDDGELTFTEKMKRKIDSAMGRLIYFEVDGRKGIVFMGWITQCRECSIKSQCLRYPDRAVARQVCFLYEKKDDGELTFTEKMKRKIDSAMGRLIYSSTRAVL